MSQKESDLTGHMYDGIEEYDNPTPAWWTWIFLATIAFALVYAPLMLVAGSYFSAPNMYERDATEAMKQQYGHLGDVKPDAATLIRLAGDEKWSKVGASLFLANCTSCHGQDGSGMAAPNLTDDYYIHVKKVEDIADVIANGRKNGAMPAWGNRLQPVEQVLVASYVASLRGRNLKSIGGRPAEGEQIPAWSSK